MVEHRIHFAFLCAALLAACCASPVQAADDTPPSGTSAPASNWTPPAGWQYGAYVDAGYVLNTNFPENHRWRSRATAARHNEFAPNLALAYVRKDASAASPWGMELGVQGGYDSKDFAYLPGEPKVSGADTLRHLHRANVSYLAPIGNGLTITGGLFNSLIGYESLYAKDNVNYTRSWLADNTPYMMFGVTAKYPVNDRLTVSGFVVNGYAHLAHPNDVPSYGAQVQYKPAGSWTVTHTAYGGPEQQQTATEFWRWYLNSIIEWRGHGLLLALSYDIGTERIADRPGTPRAFVTGGNLVARWQFAQQWAVGIRPEFYWDRNGRWTGSEQFVKVMTSTLEYSLPYRWTNMRLRLEHRWDESTGVDGGFFTDTSVVPGLTGSQHLVLLGILWTFDSP